MTLIFVFEKKLIFHQIIPISYFVNDLQLLINLTYLSSPHVGTILQLGILVAQFIVVQILTFSLTLEYKIIVHPHI